MNLSIFKAQPTGSVPVPSVTVKIITEIPNCDSLEHAREVYATDARDLAKALTTSLPGGTVHALLVALLEHKVSLLRIPEPLKEP